MAAEATGGDTDQMTAFLAEVTAWVSIAGFVVQVALTSRIHRSMGLAFALPMQQGSLADLGPGTVAITESTSESKGYDVGDTLTMEFQGGDVPLKVIAIFAAGAYGLSASPQNWESRPPAREILV